MVSESNGIRQNETFSPSQEIALGALLAGENVTAAAGTAKVDRSTVHRWLNDADFLAAFNRARAELHEAQLCRIAALATSALDVVERLLDDGNERIAVAVLRGVGLASGRPASIGSTDSARIRLDQSQADRNFEMERLLSRR